MHLLITLLKPILTSIYQTIKTINTIRLTSINLQIATLLCIFGLTISIDVIGQQKQVKSNDGIKPGKRKAVLILSDGRTVELSAKDSLNYSLQKELITNPDSTKIKPSSKNETKHQQPTIINSTTYTNSDKKKLIKE